MSRSPKGRLLSERVVDTSCVCFAVWTLCAHAITFAGGNLHDLLVTVALVAAATIAWYVVARRRVNPSAPSIDSPTPVSSDDRLSLTNRLAAGGCALLVLAAYAVSREVLVLWWGGLAVLVATSVRVAFQPGLRFTAPRAGRVYELTLWGLAIGCGILALVSHRYATDDSFYVSVAAAAADHPGWPLLSWDPLHDPELPFHNPIHRSHTYELLAGAFSYLTQIPAIYVFHWVMAGFVGILVPLCYARLLRLLAPSAWLPAVIVVVVFLIANGDTHRSYGNYAFVRMWHGKAYMLNALIPLVYVYALQFASKPSARAWALLSAAQIAAIGASSSAIWLAPLSAGLALVVGAGVRPGGIRAVVLGVFASGYPLAVGLALKSTMIATTSQHRPEGDSAETLVDALSKVIGVESFEYLCLAAVLLASLAVRGAPAQRFAALVPLGVWLVILNPHWEAFTRANVTGPSFWRAMWALPIPLLAALLISAPMQWPTRRRGMALAVVTAALVALLFAIPDRTTLHSGKKFEERIRIGWPKAKVDAQAYECARLLNLHTEEGEVVIAPERVSLWVPTFHHSARPILVRRIYLENLVKYIGVEEYRRREEITRFVSGKSSGREQARIFRRALADYNVAAVCLRRQSRKGARSALATSGFRHVDDAGRYALWVRE